MSTANTLKNIVLKRGKKSEQKMVKDILENVSEEVDLSMFRGKKGPNAMYDEKIKSEMKRKQMFKENKKLEKHFYDREKLQNDFISQEKSSNIKNKVVTEQEVAATMSNETNNNVIKNGRMDKVLRKSVPVAIGGGLIFSMCSRNGSMSSSELYGQQKPYGY